LPLICNPQTGRLAIKTLRRAFLTEIKTAEVELKVRVARRLHRDYGRHAEARNLLAPVYGWFTEGFDTQDLKEAKALLNALDA
jgi:predicted ATPase